MPNTTVPAAGEAMPKSEYWAAWQKCRELGHQLSEALAATGDNEFGFIQPAGFPHAVCFGRVQPEYIYPIEYPIQTVDRLAERLSFALDDWAEYTNWKSVAHIYPASTGRGVSYENMRHLHANESEVLGALIKRCTEALGGYDATEDDERNGAPDFPANVEVNASRRALLDFQPRTLVGVRTKARAMLSLRNFTEWDDLDQADLIRAFVGEEV